MKKPLLALLAVITVTALAWWAWIGSRVAEPVWLSGNIEMTTVDISFPTTGRLIELLPQEGSRVVLGDLLGRLDPGQSRASLDQTTARLQTIRARILETDALLKFQQFSYASQLAQATAQRAQAVAALAELENGSRQAKIAQAEALLEEARASFEQAHQDRKRFQDLFQTGDASRQQQERAESVALQARARVAQMQERLQLLREGPRVERIEAARAAVAVADAGVDQARARIHEIAGSRRRREALRAEGAGTQAEIERVSSALEDLTAYSPIEGQVLTRNGEPGEIVPAGRSILRIADTSKPWIRAYIPESDIGRIQLGSPAEVRTDSFPGKTYSGRVSFISEEAEFTPKQIQTQEQRVRWVYRIKIQVENPNGELKLNMPCDARTLPRGGS